MATGRLRLGELLVEAKVITAEQLEQALALQKTDGRRLGTLLVEAGFVNETQLTQILSQQLNAPWVSLYHIDFSRQLLNMIPRDVAEKFCLVPIYVRNVRGQGNTLYVAMDDPTNEDALRACSAHAGLPVRAMIAPPSDIRSAIRVYYGGRSSMASIPAIEEVAARPASIPDEISPTQFEVPKDAAASVPMRAATPPASVEPVEPAKSAEPEIAPRAEEPAKPASVRPAAPPSVPPPTAPAAAAPPAPTPSPPEPPRPPSPSQFDVEEGPEIVVTGERAIEPSKGRPRMVSLTLLDGTTISLPAKPKQQARPRESVPELGEADEIGGEELQITARDLIAALRAVAHGADATDVLGDKSRWEPLFAALLSVLLKKHLIADWEFIEELGKI